ESQGQKRYSDQGGKPSSLASGYRGEFGAGSSPPAVFSIDCRARKEARGNPRLRSTVDSSEGRTAQAAEDRRRSCSRERARPVEGRLAPRSSEWGSPRQR